MDRLVFRATITRTSKSCPRGEGEVVIDPARFGIEGHVNDFPRSRKAEHNGKQRPWVQVVAVVIQCEVIEYHIVSGTCACGHAQRSMFPAGIEAPVPYGPSVSALAVYMTQYQLLPYQRITEVLN